MFIISLLNGPPLLCSWYHSTSPCSSSLPFTPCPSFRDVLCHGNNLGVCVCVPAELTPPVPSCLLLRLISLLWMLVLFSAPAVQCDEELWAPLGTWHRGMPGAGSAGRGVSEESGSSTAGSPHFPSLQLCFGSCVETAGTSLWSLKVPAHSGRSQSLKLPLGLGSSCTDAFGSVPTLVFAVLLLCLHLCFSAALSLARHYQVWDHLWKWRGFRPSCGVRCRQA